jgi:hypothetical protein
MGRSGPVVDTNIETCTVGKDGMTAAETQEQSEIQRVASWRAQELERAGYTPEQAAQLAERYNDVDLHTAIDMLHGGCSPELALKILL